MLNRYRENLGVRSAALAQSLEDGLPRILMGWIVLAGLVAALKLVMSISGGTMPSLGGFAAYALVIIGPCASTLLALRWFRDGHLQPQPNTRLAVVGRWSNIARRDAERHRLYGATGIMVSLLVGMMLNVPVRAAEYFAAIPPLPSVSPSWFSSLHFAMTLDVVLLGSLYMIAFVAALRGVPLFPRLLLAIWVVDVAMQLVIAQLVTSSGSLPNGVGASLHNLLEGNVKKVLISMALWLPYLLLSTRVNVTYRHRVPI